MLYVCAISETYLNTERTVLHKDSGSELHALECSLLCPTSGNSAFSMGWIIVLYRFLIDFPWYERLYGKDI